MAVPALGKEKDSERERKLIHGAEKGVSAQIKALILLFPNDKKPQLSASVASWGKDFHALTLCCSEICSRVLASFEREGGNTISFLS